MQRIPAARSGAFTLIELMIVVAIIGILAAIAIPNFLRYQLMAKTSEGKTNLGAIRTSEAAHFAEFHVYVSADPSPPATGGSQKVAFVHAHGGGTGFEALGWEPEGNVYFNYAVAISNGGDELVGSAAADIDADTVAQFWGFRSQGALSSGLTTGKDHGQPAGNCNASNLGNVMAVAPCSPASGRSVF